MFTFFFLKLCFLFVATVKSLNENILSPSAPSPKTPSENSDGKTQTDESKFLRSNNLRSSNEINESQKLKEVFSPTVEINRLQLANEFNQELMLHQPRNRAGLLVPSTIEVPSPGSDHTPIQTPVQSRSKQGSPFYAEPADALGNVIRRSQRSSLLSQNQRHSEPPKTPLRPSQFQQILSPIESERSLRSESLDELKKKNRSKSRNRIDQWPLDSSWEFMVNEDHNDYDTDANWTRAPTHDGTLIHRSKQKLNENRITVNQIIAKRLPDLKIMELLQMTTPPANESPDTLRRGANGKSHRMSAYDNVEKGHSGYATSLMYQESTHSDDGTVFSEPWDSTQWDSFFPHDGKCTQTFIAEN